MTDITCEIIERCMRLVRQATDLDAADRAILNFVLHDALDQLATMHATSAGADCADVDELTAKLQAAETRLATLTYHPADVPPVTALPADYWPSQDWTEGYVTAVSDPTRSDWYNRGAHLARTEQALITGPGAAYDAGYHAGVSDDPAPMLDNDEWFSRGFKAGQAMCDIAGMHQDLEALRKQLADAETALEGRRNEAAESDRKINELSNSIAGWVDLGSKMTDRIEELENELSSLRAAQPASTTETGTQNQTSPVVILDATPAELAAVATAHVDGDQPQNGTSPKSSGFRFGGTDDEMRQKVVAAIQELGKRLGETPTINDWDMQCRSFGLPTAAGILGRLDRSWTTLVVDAGLTPRKRGGK